MPTQSVTLQLPDSLYEHLRRRAVEAHRSIEQETLEVLATAIPADESLPAELEEELESLQTLDDAALRDAMHSRLPEEMSAELESLHRKRQREELSEDEVHRVAELVGQYERYLLIRAQAAALLKQRGHDALRREFQNHCGGASDVMCFSSRS